MSSRTNVIKELEELINRNSLENDSNSPDFIIAEYLYNCLEIFNKTVNLREKWYERSSIIAKNDKLVPNVIEEIFGERKSVAEEIWGTPRKA